jgi:hypothetical protein
MAKQERGRGEREGTNSHARAPQIAASIPVAIFACRMSSSAFSRVAAAVVIGEKMVYSIHPYLVYFFCKCFPIVVNWMLLVPS